MAVYKSADELIGNTPLLELTHIEKAHGLKAKILAKLEYFNPAGSVKDRIAKAMIEDAEQSGKIKKRLGYNRTHKRQHRHRTCRGGRGKGIPGYTHNARNHVGRTPQSYKSLRRRNSFNRRRKRNEGCDCESRRTCRANRRRNNTRAIR